MAIWAFTRNVHPRSIEGFSFFRLGGIPHGREARVRGLASLKLTAQFHLRQRQSRQLATMAFQLIQELEVVAAFLDDDLHGLAR